MYELSQVLLDMRTAFNPKLSYLCPLLFLQHKPLKMKTHLSFRFGLLMLFFLILGVHAAEAQMGRKKKKEKTVADHQPVQQESLKVKQAEIRDSFSYSLGVLLANNLKQQGFADFDAEALLQGLQQAMKGEQQLSLAQANMLVQDGMRKQREAESKANKEAGQKFLEENAKRKGVKVTDSGLQYEIIEKGKGPIPSAEDRVKVHYEGTLIDGTVFDSSFKRGEPLTFPVKGVIKGWQEALQMMPVGSKWKLYIPAELAYGERGAGANIPPNSTLIFVVQLLEIEPKESK